MDGERILIVDDEDRIRLGTRLAIVKNILEAHECKYGVESTEGRGTAFWFDLPIA